MLTVGLTGGIGSGKSAVSARLAAHGAVVVDAYQQSFVDEPRLFSKVQEIGESLLARTGVSHPRSRWPMV